MATGFQQEPERRRRIDSRYVLILLLAVVLVVLVWGTLQRAGVLVTTRKSEAVVLAEAGKDIRAVAEAGRTSTS